MRKVILGRTAEKVSAISLGTWSYGGENKVGKRAVGWGGQSKKDSTAALRKAWDLEINHWDTADVYGNGRSEQLIGSMWEDIPRNDVFLATKMGWDMGEHSYFYNTKHMRQTMERSLKNLKTDYIDLMYLHHCDFGPNGKYFDDAIETIQRFKEDGKIKFIGLSDWSSKKIMQYIERCNPDVIQPYRNVMDDNYKSSGLKDYIDTNNLGVCFFSPIKHGLLTGKYTKPATFESGDFRKHQVEFFNEKIIQNMIQNKKQLERRFAKHPYPVMYGIVNALFSDAPTGCALLGQRNVTQVEAASTLGDLLDIADTKWVKNLYGFK